MSEQQLQGMRVAILAADGVERVEFEEPRKALLDAGADVTVLSLDDGQLQSYDDDVEPSTTFDVDGAVGRASAADYDAMVLPGGTTNPDKLRMDDDAVAFVRDVVTAGKPVGVICHGSWTMVTADVVRGRTLASWPSLKTDLENAGATWKDEQVVVDGAIVSSRNPDDVPAFCAKVVEVFATARQAAPASA